MNRYISLNALVGVMFLCSSLHAMQSLNEIDGKLYRDLLKKKNEYSQETYKTISAGIKELKSKDLDAVDDFGRSRLHYAVMLNDQKLVKVIVRQAPVDILNKQDNDGKTALYYATELLRYLSDGFLIITILLKAGANPNVQDKQDNTPLLIGIKNVFNDTEAQNLVYIFLIDTQPILSGLKEFDLNLANDQKETPLSIAQQRKFAKTVQAIKEAGVK